MNPLSTILIDTDIPFGYYFSIDKELKKLDNHYFTK